MLDRLDTEIRRDHASSFVVDLLIDVGDHAAFEQRLENLRSADAGGLRELANGHDAWQLDRPFWTHRRARSQRRSWANRTRRPAPAGRTAPRWATTQVASAWPTAARWSTTSIASSLRAGWSVALRAWASATATTAA